VNVTHALYVTLWLVGWLVMTGAVLVPVAPLVTPGAVAAEIVSVPAAVVAEPNEFVKTARYSRY
jgi:hypothetical protein